jgi:hypothetical protein
MARFTYIGSNTQTGRRVSGRLVAKDLQEATALLGRRHIKAESLQELSSPPPAELVGKPSGQYRPSQRQIAVSLMVGGLLLALPSLTAAGASQDWKPIRVSVKGQVKSIQADATLNGLQVDLHFPELPLDVSRTAPALQLDRDGHFQLVVDIPGPRPPLKLSLTFRLPGCQPVLLKELIFQGEQPECSAPQVSLGGPQVEPEKPSGKAAQLSTAYIRRLPEKPTPNAPAPFIRRDSKAISRAL